MSGNHLRRLNRHKTLCYYRVQEDSGLRHFGLFEVLCCAFEHHIGKREAKQPIGCLTHLACLYMRIVEIFAHTRELATLPRENECFCHD
jgi:hypothetical protein